MAEIGATLYETRVGRGLDVTEVEARTKIRAKYLRAMEQEEWEILPGPTFVKSFLRTYAEELGLDPRPLVEEYKFRHEPYDTAPLSRPGDLRRPERRGLPGLVPIVVVLAIIGAALYGVTQLSERDDPGAPVSPAATTTAEEAAPLDDLETVSVRLRARRATVVCLVDAGGRERINRRLRSNERSQTFRSRRFDLVVGSGRVDLFINGTRRPITGAGSNGIAYRITEAGRDRLRAAERPSCA